MKTIENTPTGTRQTVGFVDRADGRGGLTGGIESWTESTYSAEDRQRGQELREARMAAGLYLGDAARLFGIGVVEWSDCERGRRRFEDHAEALRLLAEKAGSNPAEGASDA